MNVMMMISLKKLIMMRKWQKQLVQLSWPWLPGAEQLFSCFSPSRLALGDEADEGEGRQGEGE